MKRLIFWLLLLALGGTAAWWWTRPQPVSVEVHAVARGLVEDTLANTRAGEVESCQRARMAPIMGGRIDSIEVREGDRVAAGQVLMRLWRGDLDAQRATQAAHVATARSRVAEACTQADNARRDADRQATLAGRGFVSSAAVDRARTDARARQAGCAAARTELNAAQAVLDANRVDRARLEITAPFAGTVASISGELGEIATPSPPGVATPPSIDLIDDSCLYVTAPMDEIDAPKIKPGLPARITIEAMPDTVFAGTVRRVAPYITALEKQARTVAIDVDFDDAAAARGLLVGYSTDVEIVLASHADVLRIQASVLRGGNEVLVLGADGVLAARKVETGLRNWEFVEITGGLEAGEQVVSSPARDDIVAGAQAVVAPAKSGSGAK